jgi:hypothetical protein
MRRLLPALLALLAAGCGLSPSPAPPTQDTKPVAFAILEDYDKGEDLGEVERDFALMEQLGIHEWRGSFGWDDYEPERGTYDFRWLHAFVDLAARHHLRLRPYLAYTPEWAARAGGATPDRWNDPPAHLADWQRFAARMAAEMRRHSNVISFEIYNEENASLWWDGSPADYRRVLRSGSDVLRRENPRVQILFGGLVFPDLEWMEQACADGTGGRFDVLPIHAYPETWTPPTVTVENYLDRGFFHDTFLPAVDRACGRKPIWINEAGFATLPGKTTERDQANWWARAFATFLAVPRVEQLGVYELKDHRPEAGVIGEPENYHLGLTYPDRRRKLAFFTVQRLVRLLDTGTLTVADAQVQVKVADGSAGELHHHYFIGPDGTSVLMLWDKSGAPRVDIQLPSAPRRVTEYGLDGATRPGPQVMERQLPGVQLIPGEVRILQLMP